MNWRLTPILAFLAALMLFGFGSAPKASAALGAVGPVDPAHGFPLWYQDLDGLRLDLCIDDAAMCLLELPIPGDPISFPDNFPDEVFWWAAEALMPSGDPALGQNALVVLAMEGAFLNEVVAEGDQMSFGRVRVRAGGLVPGETYVATHPYGENTLVAAANGEIRMSDDIGCEVGPCDFSLALGSGIGPFLTWDATAPAPPPGFIGNPQVEHTITGSPLGTNFFRLEGPNVGGPGVDTIETDLFAVMGKLSTGAPPTPSTLRVTTSPPVPSQVSIDGIPRDTWSLEFLKLAPGAYELSFSDVEGWSSPAPQVVTVTDGITTELAGAFSQRGFLRVITEPAVAGTIMVNGVPRNDWGMWTDLPLGSYEVCFGAVEGFTTPPCQVASVIAGFLTQVTGNYTPDPLAPGSTGFGMLRVTTSPALPSQILVNGVPRDTWGLTWLKLAPGTYEVSFADVQGFTTPTPQMVTVIEGVTTEVTGSFTQNGFLRVTTSPGLPATISVDGVPRDDWGIWTDLLPGAHEVCFGAVPGFTAPACVTLPVTAGALASVTGTYAPAP